MTPVLTVILIVVWLASAAWGFRRQRRMDRLLRVQWWLITLGYWPAVIAYTAGWVDPAQWVVTVVTASFAAMVIVNLVTFERQARVFKAQHAEFDAKLRALRADRRNFDTEPTEEDKP